MMKVRIELGEAKAGDDEFKELLDYFVDLKKPYSFDPHDPDNILLKVDTSFQETTNVMEDNGQTNVRDLSEFEYFHKIKFLQKKFKTNASQQSEFSSVE